MRIPVLEEIKLTTLEIADLKNLFKRSKVGLTPIYCDLSHLDSQRLEEVLQVLEIVLEDLNLHPKFPYPFYIVTGHSEIQTAFPLVKNEKEITKYFKKETMRVTLKEQKILEKLEVICSQIHNENISQRLNDYKLSILPQKIIKAQAKEALFLEKIIKNISGE